MNQRVTRTYAETDIVIVPNDVRDVTVYAQDFRHHTKEKLPAAVRQHLNPAHVRVFTSMADFTMWLFAIGAVVAKCWNCPRD